MMAISENVKNAILDADGSCRDVNFVGTSDSCIPNFVELLQQHFRSVTATDQDGEDVPLPKMKSVSERAPGQYWFADLSGGLSALSRAQILVHWDETLVPNVEFTFFPQDVEDVAALMGLCHNFKAALGAARFWIRYENAQWTPEAGNHHTGVIFDSAETQAAVQTP